MPEFMTADMKEKISKTVLRDKECKRIKELLEASETACDDQHKFNPSRFDMRAWEHFIKVLEYERLSMTAPKIEIGVQYLRYLGHIVSHSGYNYMNSVHLVRS